MEIGKFCHGSGVGLRALHFSWWDLLHHSNLLAKNERNLPNGSRGHSNYHSNSLRLLRSVTRSMTSHARVTSSRATRHQWRQTDRRRSAERAKFRIFQIGPLLAEIRPIFWRRVCTAVQIHGFLCGMDRIPEDMVWTFTHPRGTQFIRDSGVSVFLY